MRRFLLLATAGTLAALVATSPAAAKGPSTASLTGPGLDHAVPVKGEGESGPGTPLGSLVQLGGFFPQVFQQFPDPPHARGRPLEFLKLVGNLIERRFQHQGRTQSLRLWHDQSCRHRAHENRCVGIFRARDSHQRGQPRGDRYGDGGPVGREHEYEKG